MVGESVLEEKRGRPVSYMWTNVTFLQRHRQGIGTEIPCTGFCTLVVKSWSWSQRPFGQDWTSSSIRYMPKGKTAVTVVDAATKNLAVGEVWRGSGRKSKDWPRLFLAGKENCWLWLGIFGDGVSLRNSWAQLKYSPPRRQVWGPQNHLFGSLPENLLLSGWEWGVAPSKETSVSWVLVHK